jgi:hypothetical protein
MRYATRAFAMATPISDAVASLFLRVSMGLARQYRNYSPLKQIGTIHVAGFGFVSRLRDRWGIAHPLSSEFLLFLSVFDGSSELYLSDFGAVVPDEIDSIWGRCVRYPGARNGHAFTDWIDCHHFTTPKQDNVFSYSYFGYSGQPPAAAGAPPDRTMALVPMVLNALDLRERLRRLRALIRQELPPGDILAAMQSLISELPIGIELAAR